MIVGNRKSIDDEKYTTSYFFDNMFTETYDGIIESTGTWEIKYISGGLILEKDTNKYIILELTPTELSLSNQGRGNTLNYIYIPADKPEMVEDNKANLDNIDTR